MKIKATLRAGALMTLAVACAAAHAQAPVANGPAVTDALSSAQHRAARAHDDWQQAVETRREAEETEHRDAAAAAEAQRRYTETRAAAAASTRVLSAARARERATRAAYDRALREAHQSETAVRKK